MDTKTKEQSKEYVNKLLKWMVANNASDLFITAGFPPAVKIDGAVTPIPETQKLTPEQTAVLSTSIMNSKQYEEFERTRECNFAISLQDVGRFRVNTLQQRNSISTVIRTIRMSIPTIDELRIPAIVNKIAMEKRGLVILVGATGSGKSTTLAAMVGYRNKNSKGHIITIEDPIEYTHSHINCIVTQREVGVDTDSWEIALKNTLRQAPDVILMGEIRDRETMEYALQFAETGHLCMATLHANNANQAIDRVINFFPDERRPQTLMDLAMNLRAFVSQRLISKIGGGRVAATEILLNTPLISDKIMKGEISDIKEIMKKNRENGMITFDDAVYDLYKEGLISFENGLRSADSANEFRIKVKLGDPNNSDAKIGNGDVSKLTIV